ncbi:SKP1-like protein 4 [Linum grandiflorum]
MLELEKSAAEQSETIKKLIKEIGTDGVISLNNVTGSTLSKVIDYFRMHIKTTAKDEKLRIWDQEFVKVDLAMLFDLILVLSLSICLFYFCAIDEKAAQMISGKTTEGMRKIFNIKNDFTPQSESRN